MPKGTPTCNSIVNLTYRAVAWANVANDEEEEDIELLLLAA